MIARLFRPTNEMSLHLARILTITLLVAVAVKGALFPFKHSVYPIYIDTGRHLHATEISTDEQVQFLARQYGPAFSMMIGPFVHLPDRLGAAIWNFLGMTAFLWGARTFWVAAGAPGDRARAAFYFLLPWCGLASLFSGQLNTVMAGSFAMAAAGIMRRKWWLAAVALALPVAIKAYPLAYALVAIAMFPRALGWRVLLSLVGFAALPLLVWSPQAVADRYAGFWDFVMTGEHYSRGWVFIDLHSFIDRFIAPIDRRPYLIVQVLAGMSVPIALWAKRLLAKASDAEIAREAYFLSMGWMLVFGPATEEATYLIASPMLAWLLVDAYGARRWGRLICLAVLAAFIGPLQTSILGEPMHQRLLAWRIAPVAMLAVFLDRIRLKGRGKSAISAGAKSCYDAAGAAENEMNDGRRKELAA